MCHRGLRVRFPSNSTAPDLYTILLLFLSPAVLCARARTYKNTTHAHSFLHIPFVTYNRSAQTVTTIRFCVYLNTNYVIIIRRSVVAVVLRERFTSRLSRVRPCVNTSENRVNIWTNRRARGRGTCSSANNGRFSLYTGPDVIVFFIQIVDGYVYVFILFLLNQSFSRSL